MKQLIVYSILFFISCCTTIQNSQTTGCDWRLHLFNTGQNLDGTSNLNLIGDGQRDLKWVYCMLDYPVTNYSCTNATQTLVKDVNMVSSGLLNGTPLSLILPTAQQNSKWIIADNGQLVHTVPYYHVFTTTLCLSSEEVNNSRDFTLNINAFDSPIDNIIFNNTTVYSYTSGIRTLNLPNLLISHTLLNSGLNTLKIITIKTDLTSDEDTSDDNLIKSQFSALNVSGYLRILKCCN